MPQPKRNLTAKRDEKVIKPTDKAVPVKRTRIPRNQGPTDPAAIDRRKQFTGTDDHTRAKG